MGGFQVIDIIFIILIALMLVHGYVRGFITELFSWAAIVVAILAAVYLHPAGAAFIRGRAMSDVRYVPEILAFAGIFFIAMMICKMLERLLKNIILGVNLGGLDRILGAVFGLVEGAALTALILFVLSVQPFFDVSSLIGDSFFAQFLLPHIHRFPLERGMEIINTTGM